MKYIVKFSNWLERDGNGQLISFVAVMGFILWAIW